MHRNVTAIYRTRETADLVRRELEALGIAGRHVHVVPDREVPVASTGVRDDVTYTDQLHGLHLPDEDLRTYQHSVRRGDYVVSVEVEEAQVGRVQEIMRRPESEAYNLDTREGEFRHEQAIAYSAGDRPYNEDYLASRDPAYADPFSRTYRRNAPLPYV
ncbi:hypothetical protein [Roseitranquillus sediminis]|uniref:hypothetical protein n=1 Tax=Roseitranquillus sediminis TaxID=2809051 RepID=UPI001D0C929B|nr:hypothetical protein [Roseitranquillus sediminis]MBM9595303.1 hypothetical protein [Roseitranquillus sediminis]